MITQLLIDGVDYTRFATNPLQTQDTLDESLDLVYVELKGTSEPTPFRPFADVVLTISDGTNTRTLGMLVESDEVVETISLKKYTHSTMFIEKTKWLERMFVEKSIRQPLAKNVFDGQVFAVPEELSRHLVAGDIPLIQTYKTPLKAGEEFTFLAPDNVWRPLVGTYIRIITVYEYDPTNPQAEQSGNYAGYVKIWDKTGGAITPIPDHTITLKDTDYIVYYRMYEAGTSPAVGVSFQYAMVATKEIPPKPDYTIQDVCEQLLQNVECLTATETPLFELASVSDYDKSDEYKAQITQILESTSPEFTFSKMSLFEAFQLIGGWGHFIPRLIGNKIYFDLLGQSEKQGGNLEKYCSNTATQNTNEFCTKLDTQVSNLTNIDDESAGAISTPNNKEYRTMRTEEGVVVTTEENLIIPTEYPIEKVLKLEIGRLSDGTEVGDITPFVYEASEYAVLSDYTNRYPYSKMYALKYTEGQRNITELSFERQNVVSQVFENIAIANIIFRKIGRGPTWWRNLWDNENKFQLHYRLTYIPLTNARITQSKAHTNDIDKEISIAYNQSANKVSSNAYGEHLKGVVAKYGNIAKTKMYILPSIDLIPKVGKLFDDEYYISTVKCEYYPNYIKCEVGLSKDFNNKSAYIETNSSLQFFEYDRDLIIDRFILREDYCVLSDEVEFASNNGLMITNNAITQIANWFRGEERTKDEISYAWVRPYTQDGTNILGGYEALSLSTITLGIGNSVFCTFKFEDSVSAGSKAYYDGLTRVQEYVKYVDDYGECYSMWIRFATKTAGQDTYAQEVATGDKLPLANGLNEYIWADGQFIIQKGVGEIPHFTYQLHFVTDTDIIIGSGLAKNFPLVKKIVQGENVPRLYFLKKRINKFDNLIDLTGASDEYTLFTTQTYSNQFKIPNKTMLEEEEYVAWAVTNESGELMFGRNIKIKQGDVVKMPNFTFRHKLKGE